MGSIFDLIDLLSKSSPVGNKITSESAHGDGELREYTVEAYSKRKCTMTLSRKRKSGKKIILEVPIKLNGKNIKKVHDSDSGNMPSAVFTASGKLVYLIA